MPLILYSVIVLVRKLNCWK